jgi:hypothetical protein
MISGPWAGPRSIPISRDFNQSGRGLRAQPAWRRQPRSRAGRRQTLGIGAPIENGKLAPIRSERAIDSIGQLLGAEAPAEASPAPTPLCRSRRRGGTVAPPKKSKKREARAEPSFKPEDAAAQALQNFFGN